MVRLAFVLTSVSLVSIGLARDPGCDGSDSLANGLNAPCTRSKDCGSDLECNAGVCSFPDAGILPDSGVDAAEAGDAADDDGG